MAHSINAEYLPASFSRLSKELRNSIWSFALPDSRIVFIKKCAISRCEHAMVRVRSDLAVPDRCKNGARPGSSKILCTGMDDILPQDIKNLEEVRARIKHDGQFGFSSPTGRAVGVGYVEEVIARLNHRLITEATSAVNGKHLMPIKHIACKIHRTDWFSHPRKHGVHFPNFASSKPRLQP